MVSIIISNYNYGRFLQAAIDSALSQDYSRVEVIVVDDGSSDHSREIICGYADLIIPILKENGGQASAFNAGFSLSRGEFVIFLDSDDILLPNTARKVVEAFSANPEAAKVMYRMEVIDAGGKQTGIIKPHAHLPLRSGDLRRYVLTAPFDMTWMATSGNAFSAPVLRQIFPIPEQAYGHVGADWYLSHLAPLFGPVCFLPEVGAYYRVHSSNSYELSTETINLSHIRQTIQYAYRTQVYIKKFADQLGLVGSPKTAQDLLSVSQLALRMISLKLEPSAHPIPQDRLWRLFLSGLAATRRRFDVSIAMKTAFMLWFAVMLPAPAPIARWLAEIFSFPEKRKPLNRLLGGFHGAS